MVTSATTRSHIKWEIVTQNIKNGAIWWSPQIKCIIRKNKLSDSEVEFFFLRIYYKTFSKTYAKLCIVSIILNMVQTGTNGYRITEILVP